MNSKKKRNISRKKLDGQIVLNNHEIVLIFELIQFARQEYQNTICLPSVRKAFKKLEILEPIVYSIDGLGDDLEGLIDKLGLKVSQN